MYFFFYESNACSFSGCGLTCRPPMKWMLLALAFSISSTAISGTCPLQVSGSASMYWTRLRSVPRVDGQTCRPCRRTQDARRSRTVEARFQRLDVVRFVQGTAIDGVFCSEKHQDDHRIRPVGADCCVLRDLLCPNGCGRWQDTVI